MLFALILRIALYFASVYFAVNVAVACWSNNPGFAVVAGIVCYTIFTLIAYSLSNSVYRAILRSKEKRYRREYGR